MSHRGKCTFVVNFFFLFVSDSELRTFKFKMTESTSDDASAIIAPVASLCSRFYSEHENRGRHRTGTETQKRLMSRTRCADERKFVWFAGKNSDTTDQHQRGRRKKKSHQVRDFVGSVVSEGEEKAVVISHPLLWRRVTIQQKLPFIISETKIGGKKVTAPRN